MARDTRVTNTEHVTDELQRDVEANVTESGNATLKAEAMDGGLVLEDWDDLLDLTPGSRVLVPLEARLGGAVWTWSRTMHHDNPAGRLSRGIRDLLLAMDRHEVVSMLQALNEMLAAFAALLEISRPADR